MYYFNSKEFNKSTTYPYLFLPVLPNRYINLVGFKPESKHNIKFTSFISKPSSATLVAINIFIKPLLKLSSVSIYYYCVIYISVLDFLSCPIKIAHFFMLFFCN